MTVVVDIEQTVVEVGGGIIDTVEVDAGFAIDVSLKSITLITGQNLSVYNTAGDLIGMFDQNGNFAIKGRYLQLQE